MYFLTKYIIIKMRKLFIICALLFCLGTASAQQKFSVASPDGKLKLVLDIAPEKVAYSVKYGKQQLLEDSRLGFEFDSGEFGAGLKAGKVQRRKIDEAYELVVGKVVPCLCHEHHSTDHCRNACSIGNGL